MTSGFAAYLLRTQGVASSPPISKNSKYTSGLGFLRFTSRALPAEIAKLEPNYRQTGKLRQGDLSSTARPQSGLTCSSRTPVDLNRHTFANPSKHLAFYGGEVSSQ